MSFEVKAGSSILGGEIRNLDLRQPLDDAVVARLRDAWSAYLVLFFRDQHLTDQDLIRFSSHFGVCDRVPTNEASVNGLGHVPLLPEVAVISNVVDDGEPIGALGNGELAWHTDMSNLDEPSSASALYAIEVPKHGGGDTSFLNMYTAYEALPSGLKEKIRDRHTIHDAIYTSAGTRRKGLYEIDDVRDNPGAHHPMLRTHPVTGRTALFLGRRVNSYIIGLSVEESEALLNEVWAHTIQDEFIYTHHWQPGDLVLWDNRCVMHRRGSFDSNDRRIMHRTQLKGEIPYYVG